LRQKLGMDEQKLMLTFQSRFGRARWLEPATIDSVKALAKRGVLVKDTHGATIRISPPIVVTRDELDFAVAALGDVLAR